MQDHNWDDLRFLLALHRTGKLSEAGRSIGASETTVARRLKRLERSLGLRSGLFIRNALGKYSATDMARAIIEHAETVERENIAIRERIGNLSGTLTGVVRVSSVPIIVNRMLIPNLWSFRQTHPDIMIELVPDTRNADLSKREADLAVRFARPIHGGLNIKAQKLGAIEFGVFCPAASNECNEKALGWIGYDDANASLPQARWIEANVAQTKGAHVLMRVSDAETALEAVASGLGKSILPYSVGCADHRLRVISAESAVKRMERDVWLLSHIDQATRASVNAVKEWLVDLCWDSGS